MYSRFFLVAVYLHTNMSMYICIFIDYYDYWCVCTLLITCSLNIDLAGECGMIVGPHSTKLPQSWDTGSDQPSVPASEDSNRLS